MRTTKRSKSATRSNFALGIECNPLFQASQKGIETSREVAGKQTAASHVHFFARLVWGNIKPACAVSLGLQLASTTSATELAGNQFHSHRAGFMGLRLENYQWLC